ncbi:D-alanyl-D-alanine carboxypeptidase [Gammaproteobacteria bacterium]|nr:D-alanyl-D-alanine carboxypeptidase [Gammaproteobacteria bacterium]
MLLKTLVISLALVAAPWLHAITVPEAFVRAPYQKSLLLVSPDNEVVISENAGQPMVLASVTKLFTAWAALNHLGPQFRFFTDISQDADTHLYITGYGDPWLTSEELEVIALNLKRKGIDRVGNIVVDDRQFGDIYRVDGQTDTRNPYDAPLGALSANFNSVSVRREAGKVVSGESQTELTATGRELADRFLGKRRSNRLALLQQPHAAAFYFGEIFLSKLVGAGVTVGGNVVLANGPLPSMNFSHRHHSTQTVRDLIVPMLKYSTNFVANQLFVSLSLFRGGEVDIDHSARLVANTALDSGVEQPLIFAEGAGLSRRNVATAAQVVDLLDAMLPEVDLMPEIMNGVYAKTGTLRDTSTLAGYLLGADGRYWRFALLFSKPDGGIDRRDRLRIAESLRDQVLLGVGLVSR